MVYEQFHALLTAILYAGRLANPQDDNEISLRDTAELAGSILKKCDFVTREEWLARSR